MSVNGDLNSKDRLCILFRTTRFNLFYI